MRLLSGFLAWFVGATAIAQMLPPNATLVLGAGKAGDWDTAIAVTNVDSEPIDIAIRPWFVCGPLAQCPPDYASATIEPLATYILPSIPELDFPWNGPQAVYVTSPLTARRLPVVSAVVADRVGACERSMVLPGVPNPIAYAAGDLVFTGVERTAGQYSNLILSTEPSSGPPHFGEAVVRVRVRDARGTVVAQDEYTVTSRSAVVVVDFLRELGVETLEAGSVELSLIPLPEFGNTPFSAVITRVEPNRALAFQGTRVAAP